MLVCPDCGEPLEDMGEYLLCFDCDETYDIDSEEDDMILLDEEE